MPIIDHYGSATTAPAPPLAEWVGNFAPGADLTRFSSSEVFADIPIGGEITGLDLDFSIGYSSNHTNATQAHICAFGLCASTEFDGTWNSPKTLYQVLLHDAITTSGGPTTFGGSQHYLPGYVPTAADWRAGVTAMFMCYGVDGIGGDGPGGTYVHDCHLAVNSLDLTVSWHWEELIEYPVAGTQIETRRIFSF